VYECNYSQTVTVIAGTAYSAPADPLAGFEGAALLRGRERKVTKGNGGRKKRERGEMGRGE